MAIVAHSYNLALLPEVVEGLGLGPINPTLIRAVASRLPTRVNYLHAWSAHMPTLIEFLRYVKVGKLIFYNYITNAILEFPTGCQIEKIYIIGEPVRLLNVPPIKKLKTDTEVTYVQLDTVQTLELERVWLAGKPFPALRALKLYDYTIYNALPVPLPIPPLETLVLRNVNLFAGLTELFGSMTNLKKLKLIDVIFGDELYEFPELPALEELYIHVDFELFEESLTYSQLIKSATGLRVLSITGTVFLEGAQLLNCYLSNLTRLEKLELLDLELSIMVNPPASITTLMVSSSNDVVLKLWHCTNLTSLIVSCDRALVDVISENIVELHWSAMNQPPSIPPRVKDLTIICNIDAIEQLVPSIPDTVENLHLQNLQIIIPHMPGLRKLNLIKCVVNDVFGGRFPDGLTALGSESSIYPNNTLPALPDNMDRVILLFGIKHVAKWPRWLNRVIISGCGKLVPPETTMIRYDYRHSTCPPPALLLSMGTIRYGNHQYIGEDMEVLIRLYKRAVNRAEYAWLRWGRAKLKAKRWFHVNSQIKYMPGTIEYEEARARFYALVAAMEGTNKK